MYGEWYGVCNFAAPSAVEARVDYGGVNVFYVCLNPGVVYGVGACVNASRAACAAAWCLFLTCGCCLLCCSTAGVQGAVIFVSSVMRVVGGVPHGQCVYFAMKMLRVCVCCAPSCYSECGILCYL